MAHTTRIMDKEARSNNVMLRPLNPPKHLKPLSVYSRMITCEQNSSFNHPRIFSSPLINFNIEVVNICANKRKLDDSSPDDGYETLVKKPFSAKALSPDLGCFMDHCSPLARRVSVSPFVNSNPALVDRTQAIGGEMKETAIPHLHSDYVECGSSTDPGGEEETALRSLKCERFLLNPAPAFDYDVDNLLGLNPFATCSVAGFSGSVDSCKCPHSNVFTYKPVVIPTVAHRHEAERRVGQVEEERDELKKVMCLNVKDEEEDKGYFSMSYINDHKIAKSPLQLPPAASSPLLRTGEVEPPGDARHPENSSEPQCHEQAVMSGQCFSSIVDDFCPTVSGLLLKPLKFPAECLEADVEEVWSIGPPMFESSTWHNATVKINAASEQSRQEDVTEPVHDCEATVRTGEDTSLDTSYETTLPLQVQVKSKVVVHSQQTTSSKPVSLVPQGGTTKPTKPNEDRSVPPAERARRQRLFNKEMDWELETKQYVQAVTRHMKENPGADRGVMSELQDLMTRAADQTTDSKGRQWQHPSDLTRRNYQRRFGNTTPKVALSDWKAKSSLTHKRFAKVPKCFERSHFP